MYKCPYCESTELTIFSVIPHNLNDEDYEFMQYLRHTDFLPKEKSNVQCDNCNKMFEFKDVVESNS